MTCDLIRYQNFRNIEDQTVAFDPGINVISGENAAGKTNALEGIYLYARGRSFRGAKDGELIKFGCRNAMTELTFTDRLRTQQMSIRYEEGGKKACRKNGVDVRKMSDFIGHFRAVLFCPLHLSIVKSGPAVRRSFMDVALAQLSSIYTTTLSKYNSILLQRNALLKDVSAGGPFGEKEKAMLDVLSIQLAHEAAYIAAERAEYVDRVDRYVRTLFADMTKGNEQPAVKYVCGKTEEQYYKQLTENIDRELHYGVTMFGTHRDDIIIYLNHKEARLYASQGQQRSLALAMKLAEGELSRERTQEYPVFLFDDVFSELDERRRRYITEGLGGKQVIITSCEPNILSMSGDRVKIFTTSDGQYKEI